MAGVEGFVADGFEAVRETLQGFVDDGRETGAGLSIWRDGREVVQLCAGWADAQRRHPWRGDTLVQPYSLSKPFAAFAALVAVKDGAMELDEPVAKYWQSYGRHGKDRTTLRQLLSHQAVPARGRPWARSSTTWCDRRWGWTPGSGCRRASCTESRSWSTRARTCHGCCPCGGGSRRRTGSWTWRE